ncbi:hypothetical protein D3C85_1664370 [compost metagenome]
MDEVTQINLEVLVRFTPARRLKGCHVGRDVGRGQIDDQRPAHRSIAVVNNKTIRHMTLDT